MVIMLKKYTCILGNMEPLGFSFKLDIPGPEKQSYFCDMPAMEL